ncbi:DUF1990 family protein [Streptomyces sp. NPDC006879]|uniref:DUF1990 family protein n=1 Tax=Streptomyces sp. NPDC006879 TaxID=3364767 RepID=UPI0036A08A69
MIKTRRTLKEQPTPNYPERGATLAQPLPAGYNHLRYRTRIGHGRAVFEAAGEAVTTYRMHKAAGVHMRSDLERAQPGVRVDCRIGFGPMRFAGSCEVIWTAYEHDLLGFAYGTLGRHPEAGEESFLVELGTDGTVWFTVTAFSRPNRWYTRAAGPLIPQLQRSYAWNCGRTLRRLTAGV